MNIDITDPIIAKFNIKDRNFYIRFLWEDNDHDLFSIKICEGNKNWSGIFTVESAENFRSLVDENEEEYKLNVRNYLTSQCEDFIYDFEVSPDDSNMAIFSWKKVFEDSTIMAHGSVPMHLDNETDGKYEIIDFLLYENQGLREAIESLNRRNDALTANLDTCKHELEDFMDMKTTLETTLYGKFIQLLNEKKNRIRLLEETIQKYEDM